MKNPILVAVILQLVITIIEINGNYQFGDIIAFPLHCKSNNSRPRIIHFAVYVGPLSEKNVGQGDNDIVHHTGVGGKYKCVFGKLAMEKDKDYQEIKYNYLDGIAGYKAGTPDEIAARIVDYVQNCPKYNPIKKNCEHMATTIRYGEKHTLQCGALIEGVVTFSNKGKHLLKQVKELHKVVKCIRRG